MYPHFIEVTIFEGPKAIINIDQIKAVATLPDFFDGAIIYYSTAGKETVRESYDEVKGLIESSGALINMGDPRLDTKHRLTKEDIKEMQAGEPVWNSNDREWYQIAGWNGQNDFYVTLQSIHKVIRLSEDDLIKFPFYRMKVE